MIQASNVTITINGETLEIQGDVEMQGDISIGFVPVSHKEFMDNIRKSQEKKRKESERKAQLLEAVRIYLWMNTTKDVGTVLTYTATEYRRQGLSFVPRDIYNAVMSYGRTSTDSDQKEAFAAYLLTLFPVPEPKPTFSAQDVWLALINLGEFAGFDGAGDVVIRVNRSKLPEGFDGEIDVDIEEDE